MTDTATPILESSTKRVESDTNNNNLANKADATAAQAYLSVPEADESHAAGGAGKDENEIVLIQESAFTIKIHVPGIEPFDLQVTSMELVQEIHQMLMDKEETCHRTCFSLQLDGVPLDNFSELKAIEGIKEGSVIKLVDG